MSGTVNFKVYLVNEDNYTKEIRRFGIDNDVVTNYVYLNEKIQCIFSGLRGQTFSIAWRDAEGDKITISSDEELQTALNECHTDGICRLYVLLENQTDLSFVRNPEVFKLGRGHHRCGKRAHRLREKCMQEMEKNQNSPLGVLKMSKDYISRLLDIFGLDFDIEIESDNNPSTSKSHRNEQKTECQNNAEPSTSGESTPRKTTPEKETVKKFPGKGNTLIEKKNVDVENMDNTASSTVKDVSDISKAMSDTSITKETPNTKPGAPEEWTLVDKMEASNISSTSSASNILNQTAVEPDTSTQSNSKGESVYPKLPEDQKVYHSDPEIQQAVETLIAMGFSNKDGSLTYMLESENGNVLKVLESLLSSFR